MHIKTRNRLWDCLVLNARKLADFRYPCISSTFVGIFIGCQYIELKFSTFL